MLQGTGDSARGQQARMQAGNQDTFLQGQTCAPIMLRGLFMNFMHLTVRLNSFPPQRHDQTASQWLPASRPPDGLFLRKASLVLVVVPLLGRFCHYLERVFKNLQLKKH